MLRFLFGALFLSGLWQGIAWSNDGDAIRVQLEEPMDGASYASVSNVRGWAVGPAPIVQVALFIDGEHFQNLPTGAVRRDVAAAFPHFADALTAGFSAAYNYGNLDAGEHTFLVRAVDANGDTAEAGATFTSARFQQSFVAQSSAGSPVGFDDAAFSGSGSGIHIDRLRVGDSNYDVDLTWRTAKQGFEFSAIRLSSIQPPPPACPGCGVFGNVTKQPCPTQVELNLEEPANGRVYASVENIRGWGAATGGFDRIDLYVDGAFESKVPLGGRRDDVRQVHEDGCPEVVDAGFSMAYFFARLGSGEHEIELRGYSNFYGNASASSRFSVVSFANGGFLGPETPIELSEAGFRVVGADSFEIDRARVDGVPYRVRLQWVTAKQGFSIVDIVRL